MSPADNNEGPSWIDLRDAAPLFGMTFEGVKNSIVMGRFPVPTYKLGRRRVIDRAVLSAFFEKKKADGLLELQGRPPAKKK